eukprot:Phypoly_transcript_05315.p1 GENE.Phypoly_transcript_05315~~Phypoly_transcript_05315.p1  ORF type:complete len:245 (-),score=28.05 Phypoly_transcript_05315:1224-1958(-)
MVAFDVPSLSHHQNPFEIRYALLLTNAHVHHQFVVVAARILGTNDKFAELLVTGIIANGGEGLILRRCGSFYENGRSLSLIKLKASECDAEGMIVGIGSKKSVVLKLPNGHTLEVPADQVHICTPAIGDIVTFTSEMSLHHHTPSTVAITRIRTDMCWNDVLHSFYISNRPDAMQDLSSDKTVAHPLGFWTTKNMRSFLESFACNRNLDPLLPETWYRLVTDIQKSKFTIIFLKIEWQSDNCKV